MLTPSKKFNANRSSAKPIDEPKLGEANFADAFLKLNANFTNFTNLG
jgi:hypothetical protein